MIKYKDFQPTGFDHKGLGLTDRQEWYVAPCARNRDSGIMTESNWEQQKKALEEVDSEEENHEVHNFGHWANGWFEIVLVKPASLCFSKAEELEEKLENYPLLNEDDVSEKEFEAVCDEWERMSLSEKIDMCKEVGISIFAARRPNIPEKCWDKLAEIVRTEG